MCLLCEELQGGGGGEILVVEVICLAPSPFISLILKLL